MYNLYYQFTRVPFLRKSYALKFLFIAFLGIHMPLILFASLFLTSIAKMSSANIFWVLLFTTLVATLITLVVQNHLLYPIRQAYGMLNNYMDTKQLPVDYPDSQDEIGKLIKHIHSTIYTVDKLIQEKEEVGILLSHDLRMPLSQIVMLTQAMKHENISPETAKQIKMISAVAEEQLGFIGEMLLLFKSEKGISMEASFRPVYLYDVVEKVLKETRIAAFTKGLNIFNNIPENVFLYAQKDLLKQAIQNLLSNSIKFSHNDGSIYIDVNESGPLLHINIKDEGIGFTNEEGGKLFTLKPVRKEGTMGERSNGMGLYFVRKIAEKHNGDVIAKSEGLNHGAVFSIRMPFKSLTA